MATILGMYSDKRNNIRKQINDGKAQPADSLLIQELNYRIGVLETFQDLIASAPITNDRQALGFHYHVVTGNIKCLLDERRFGPKTNDEGLKKRETAFTSFDNVVKDGTRRFSSFAGDNAEWYRNEINNYIKTILPMWVQYRNTYINIEVSK